MKGALRRKASWDILSKAGYINLSQVYCKLIWHLTRQITEKNDKKAPISTCETITESGQTEDEEPKAGDVEKKIRATLKRLQSESNASFERISQGRYLVSTLN